MIRKHYIYKHTSPSGKVYIGQTVNIKKRWGTNGEHYKTKKKNGDFIQHSFARAILKYGWENFTHEIILECHTKAEADYAERYLIKWYKLHNISYNITEGGEGTMGVHQTLSSERKAAIRERMRTNHPMKGKHHTPEALAKIIAANRNRTYTEEQKKAMADRARITLKGKSSTTEVREKLSKYKKEHPETWIGGWNKVEIHQYDLKGNYIASYPSATDAANALNKNINGDISRCAKGFVASAGGFLWREKKVDFIDMSKYKVVVTPTGSRIYDISEEGKRKRRNGHGRKVNQYSLDGRYIQTFNSVTDAKEALNYKGGGISKCCLHQPRYASAAGHLWEYDTIDNRRDKNGDA